MEPRTIETPADIAIATAALVAACPHLARIHALTGPPPLRRRPAGFAGLARIVVGQQLSIASAGAIWNRLERCIEPFEPEAFLQAAPARLRAAGLSTAKITTLRGVAEAAAEGRLDFARLARAADTAAVRAELTRLKGIGPWTADIYAMFCLGQADAWAPGDLALRHALADALALKAVPDEAGMVAAAEPWRPWRAVAARLLWSYYRLRNQGGSGAPA